MNLYRVIIVSYRFLMTAMHTSYYKAQKIPLFYSLTNAAHVNVIPDTKKGLFHRGCFHIDIKLLVVLILTLCYTPIYILYTYRYKRIFVTCIILVIAQNI